MGGLPVSIRFYTGSRTTVNAIPYGVTGRSLDIEQSLSLYFDAKSLQPIDAQHCLDWRP
ncbi:Hypothetical predicted protein [Pelobates cultripes]|uniref:Uncharacterized protein n=1 Tax=Pelobates cultripes TaxID=61616 RepID=A0AAD1T8D6_PELCU|nr:Hypothetical predicted protein [Pelobates cultripes]